MRSTRQTGNTGEDFACSYLQNKGFDIIQRKYLKKWGEIDIVCTKDKIIHFVEVKSITQVSSFTSNENLHNIDSHRPEDNVHDQKLRRMRRVIETYLWEIHKGQDIQFQVDIICVYLNSPLGNGDKSARVKMISNVII